MSIRIITLVFLVFSSCTLFSQGYYIKNYDVDMVLEEDGSLAITEDITVYFEEKRQGIIRDIPFRYKWEGKNVRVQISDINVPNYKTKVSNKGAEKSIRIGTKGKFLQGEQQYEISYKVKGHIAAYEDFLELYWNPIPTDWDTRIEAYSYKLRFAKQIDLQFDDYKVFSGAENSTDNSATIQFVNNELSGRSTTSLKARQGVTIAVKLPANYIPADLVAQSAKETQSNRSQPLNNDPWTWIVSALGILGFIGLRQKIDGKSQEDKNINEQHYPPENMSAAQVGYFIDHKANDRDIMSLIPQWGAEGLIELVKNEDDTTIKKKGPLPQGLPEYEHTLFNAIFQKSDTVQLSDLKYELAGSLYKAQTQLSAEQKQSDLYDETSMTYLHSWRTILAAIALIAFGILTLLFWKSIVICVTSIILGIALFIIYFTEPKHSQTGIRIKNHLLGLEQFLKNHDGSDYPDLMKKDPRYFDKIFPYAVALGIDTNFLKWFGDHVDYSPHWYGYHHSAMSTMAMTSPMRGFAQDFDVKEITSVFSSVKTPQAGSGGGFSGGGSVGGGFGGGGGSSW